MKPLSDKIIYMDYSNMRFVAYGYFLPLEDVAEAVEGFLEDCICMSKHLDAIQEVKRLRNSFIEKFGEFHSPQSKVVQDRKQQESEESWQRVLLTEDKPEESESASSLQSSGDNHSPPVRPVNKPEDDSFLPIEISSGDLCDNCGYHKDAHQYSVQYLEHNRACKKFKPKQKKGCGKEFYVGRNLYECGYKKLCPSCQKQEEEK